MDNAYISVKIMSTLNDIFFGDIQMKDGMQQGELTFKVAGSAM